MQLRIRLSSGHIHDLDCDELISIDGREFKPEAPGLVEERILLLEGRLETLESIISQYLQTPKVPS